MGISGISAPTPGPSDAARPPEMIPFALVRGTAQNFASTLIPLRPDQQQPVAVPPKDQGKDKVANDKPRGIGARPRAEDEAGEDGAGTPGRDFSAATARARPHANPPAFASSVFMAHSLAQDQAEFEPTAQSIRAAVAAYGRGLPASGPETEAEILPPMPRLASGRMVDLAV